MRDDLINAICSAANAAGIKPSRALAIVEVETGGDPFESDGRTPQLLFERHVFHRELSAHAPGKLNAAVRAGLAIKKWSPSTQYKDQGKSAGRLALLARARAVDDECALRSASYGLPQVMGNECDEVGFDSARALFDHLLYGGVQAHVDVLIRLIRAKGLVEALNSGEWARVARVYNGSGYKKNSYDTRLAAADARWQRKLSTMSGRTTPPEQSLSRAEVETVQERLVALGYAEVGKVDGKWGSKTSAALFRFQSIEGISPATGSPDRATLDLLYAHDTAPAPVSRERAAIDADDVRDEGSRTVAAADAAGQAGKVATGIGTAGAGISLADGLGLLDQAKDASEKASGIWGAIKDIVPSLPPHTLGIALGIALAAVGVYVLRQRGIVISSRVEDERTGVHA